MKEVKRGEIYFANLNPVQGSEQGGTRPVLILQNNVGNKHSPTTIVAAITSKQLAKCYIPTDVTIKMPGYPSESVVLLNQIRTLDKARLGGYVGTLSAEQMSKVDKAIVISLGIEYLEELLK